MRCPARLTGLRLLPQAGGQRDGHNGKNPTLAVERKLLRRCHHTLRELGDTALAPPVPEAKKDAA